MSDDDWMRHLLGDARDQALQTGRATIVRQQQQLVLAEARIAELNERLLDEQTQVRDAELELQRIASEFATFAGKFDQLEDAYRTIQAELVMSRHAVSLLQTEYGKAGVRVRTLEARFTGLLRRLLGDAGVAALVELAREGVEAIAMPRPSERWLLTELAPVDDTDPSDRAGQPTRAH